VWKFHTYRKFADELYEVYENIYIYISMLSVLTSTKVDTRGPVLKSTKVDI